MNWAALARNSVTGWMSRLGFSFGMVRLTGVGGQYRITYQLFLLSATARSAYNDQRSIASESNKTSEASTLPLHRLSIATCGYAVRRDESLGFSDRWSLMTPPKAASRG